MVRTVFVVAPKYLHKQIGLPVYCGRSSISSQLSMAKWGCCCNTTIGDILFLFRRKLHAMPTHYIKKKTKKKNTLFYRKHRNDRMYPLSIYRLYAMLSSIKLKQKLNILLFIHWIFLWYAFNIHGKCCRNILKCAGIIRIMNMIRFFHKNHDSLR